MTKILVSSGYGSGWSTWAYGNDMKAIAEYQPIIEFLEAGGDSRLLSDEHPLVIQMMKDLGIQHFYTGGSDGLHVVEVDGKYRINEYDGSETVQTAVDFW